MNIKYGRQRCEQIFLNLSKNIPQQHCEWIRIDQSLDTAETWLINYQTGIFAPDPHPLVATVCRQVQLLIKAPKDDNWNRGYINKVTLNWIMFCKIYVTDNEKRLVNSLIVATNNDVSSPTV